MYDWLRAQLALAVDAKSPNTIGQTSCAALSRSDSDNRTESVQLIDRVATGVLGTGTGAALGAGADDAHAAAATTASNEATLRWRDGTDVTT